MIFEDNSKTVDSEKEHFVIDIYSKDPLVIAACTRFLNEDEKDKLIKLMRIKSYFKENNNEYESNLFFITYDIDDSIKKWAIDFCKEGNIELVMSSH